MSVKADTSPRMAVRLGHALGEGLLVATLAAGSVLGQGAQAQAVPAPGAAGNGAQADPTPPVMPYIEVTNLNSDKMKQSVHEDQTLLQACDLHPRAEDLAKPIRTVSGIGKLSCEADGSVLMTYSAGLDNQGKRTQRITRTADGGVRQTNEEHTYNTEAETHSGMQIDETKTITWNKAATVTELTERVTNKGFRLDDAGLWSVQNRDLTVSLGKPDTYTVTQTDDVSGTTGKTRNVSISLTQNGDGVVSLGTAAENDGAGNTFRFKAEQDRSGGFHWEPETDGTSSDSVKPDGMAKATVPQQRLGRNGAMKLG